MIFGMATPNEAAAYAGWTTVQEEWADKKYIISGSTVTPFETAGENTESAAS